MDVDSMSGVDVAEYERVLRFVGSLSGLFSDNVTPLIDPRVAEKLFCHLTSSQDKSRLDVSFDAITPDGRGVGVKTYGLASSKVSVKSEKIAEFTKDAGQGVFSGLPAREIAHEVSRLRNARLASDAAELGISLEGAFYHSLVRVPRAAFINEVALRPVDLSEIRPVNQQGVVQARFPSGPTGNVAFTDGHGHYSFSRAKNVLSRRFDLSHGFNSPLMPLTPMADIWKQLIAGELELLGAQLGKSQLDNGGVDQQPSVVLPLYSTKAGVVKVVPEKSGINQWNAGGRKRSFGEAYIPIPRKVHDLAPGFFPPRDEKFTLLLPSGSVVTAKVCQQGSKALMSDPNTELLDWLFRVLDGSLERSASRSLTRRPYVYDNLAEVDKDSVLVAKSSKPGIDYELTTAPVGSYEDWVNEMQQGKDIID